MFYIATSRRHSLFTKFINNDFDNGLYKNEVIDKILAESNGYIIYQEQINDILSYVLEYDYYNANAVRKDIAKKKVLPVVAAATAVYGAYKLITKKK